VINYNFTAVHVTPLYQALADQAIIREAMNDDAYTISATIHPLPITAREDSYGQAEDAFLAWFLLVLSFPFIAGTFGTFIVAERQSKAKHLQTVAGVKESAYWLSSYSWDILNYQLPLWITVILMFAFGVETFTTGKRGVVGGVVTTLVLFGPAAAGFTYCVSFAFSSPSMCNLFIIIFSFLIGLAGPIVALILRLLGEDLQNPNASLVTAANAVEWILRFVPAFNLGSGLFKCINVETYEYLAGKPITVWHNSVILYEVIFQCMWCFVYVALAMQIDRWSSNPRAVNIWRMVVRVVTCQCCCGGGSGYSGEAPPQDAIPDDEDVIAEQDRVLAGDANSDLMVLNQLTKQYGNGKLAVNNLSLGIPPGQCFGLLGTNGAGKTTTMGMLTAEFPPSSGDATLAGFSVTNEPEKTRRRIGYCPQFDAHFMNMTGREHVALYAAIKGVPRDMVKEAVQYKLAEVGLSEFDSDRLSAGYSGGMKRKLSVACATIGQPQIVFLDEPSTGMDPVARRDLWGVISEMVSGGNIPDEQRTSVILTTHSMAECEALCPRIGIMAAGKLRCIGSAQHLKTRFGQGFQVEMKLEAVEPDHEDYKAAMVDIAENAGVTSTDVEENDFGDVFLNLDQTRAALEKLSGDSSLSSKISGEDPTGYVVYRNASSPVGVLLPEVASFATAELRMGKLDKFFKENFTAFSLRERQDSKARYEVGSADTRISSIFAKIEGNKADLRCSDYGVSQTSLEQVFNMHAAEAEKLKQGVDDH
jgi:ATP-binding cassette, subfamily A (ABC1), member 3